MESQHLFGQAARWSLPLIPCRRRVPVETQAISVQPHCLASGWNNSANRSIAPYMQDRDLAKRRRRVLTSAPIACLHKILPLEMLVSPCCEQLGDMLIVIKV